MGDYGLSVGPGKDGWYWKSVSIGKYQRVYGFRYQRQLQTPVKAIALFKGKNEVDEECLNELEELLNYVNFEFNKI